MGVFSFTRLPTVFEITNNANGTHPLLLHEVEKYEILLKYFENERRALAAELRRT